MSRAPKFLIGLLAVLIMGWIYHGPLGRGEMLIDSLEAKARAAVAEGEVPGVEVRLGRNPLSRKAILSGPADEFQRTGMGSFPGLNQRVLAIPGISGVEWSNPPPPRKGNR